MDINTALPDEMGFNAPISRALKNVVMEIIAI